MANIIVQKNPFQELDEDEIPFVQLIKNPIDGYNLRNAMCKALQKSFDEDEKRMGSSFRNHIQTQHEVKRRTEILCKWFRTVRAEMGYSTDRAISILYPALRTELDGGVYEPPKAEGMFEGHSA